MNNAATGKAIKSRKPEFRTAFSWQNCGNILKTHRDALRITMRRLVGKKPRAQPSFLTPKSIARPGVVSRGTPVEIPSSTIRGRPDAVLRETGVVAAGTLRQPIHAHQQQQTSAALQPPPPRSVNYVTLPTGDRCAMELVPHIEQGKMIRISPIVSQSVNFFAARFPEGFNIPDLKHPLAMEPDMISAELIGAEGPSAMLEGGGYNSFNRGEVGAAKRATDPPWRLRDSAGHHLIGRRSDMDCSGVFAMIEQPDCFELIPLDSWCLFQAANVNGSTEHSTADLAERKRRAALQAEEHAAATLRQRFGVAAGDGEEAAKLINDVYAEDGGLSHQKKKKLKQAKKARSGHYREEDETVGDSALNLRGVKRAEVDWDWDDDGKASDDEDDALSEAKETEVLDQKNDFEDSNDEQEDVALSNFGKSVVSALDSQKERDLEDELAQFSDEDDEEMSAATPPASSTAPAAAAAASTQSRPRASAARQAGSDSPEAPLVAMRARVVRTLLQEGGRMPARGFLARFHVSSQTSSNFQPLKQAMSEVCEVHAETVDGVPTKFLLLKPQFRRPL